MVQPAKKQSKNRCLLCSGELEKSNMGSLCNPCKDKMYKFDFTSPKKAEIKIAQHKK